MGKVPPEYTRRPELRSQFPRKSLLRKDMPATLRQNQADSWDVLAVPSSQNDKLRVQ